MANTRISAFLWIPCLALAVASSGCRAGASVDFADSRQAESWLRHPVYGDPSFDAFERAPGNPILRGAPPFEWPVNGFLFRDPASGSDYAYVGEYAEGYLARPSRCRLFRSTNGGRSWEDLGVVLRGDPDMFDKGGHTPDVSVVFDAGRYHMVYDWGEPNFNAEGGLAYAWAEKPEGPWHRAAQPITRNSAVTKLLGRYQRTYAGTLVRRKRDWLIAAMTDAAPNSWALFVMTAPRPEGPWSERRIVRGVEGDGFHPPLLEFFPAFVHGGFLYAPATSVALNRDFNVLFRAPLERAAEPQAWEIVRHGSLWHSEDVEGEHYGLWGQTFSGSVDAAGVLRALFNSRDERGFGTVNLARRAWDTPLRPRGFVLSAYQGPAFTCLERTYRRFKLDATLSLRGTAMLLWDYRGPLGPNLPQSDATMNPLSRTRFDGFEMSATEWRVIRVDDQGRTGLLSSGTVPEGSPWRLSLERRADGGMVIGAGGRTLWAGAADPEAAKNHPGALGLWVESNTHLFVEKFKISGEPLPARLSYLGQEALLGAGEPLARWEERSGPEFRYGLGLISKEASARVKWSVSGARFTLWSPLGPDFGEAEILVDGRLAAVVHLRSDAAARSRPVWTSARLSGRFHAIVWRAVNGRLPVDCLEAEY